MCIKGKEQKCEGPEKFVSSVARKRNSTDILVAANSLGTVKLIQLV